jgi:hypothetical protein
MTADEAVTFILPAYNEGGWEVVRDRSGSIRR